MSTNRKILEGSLTTALQELESRTHSCRTSRTTLTQKRSITTLRI
jgi:hypothetical protein